MPEICGAGCFCAVMSGRYKVVNREFVLLKEGMNVLLVEYFGALCLW
jgi:hypothetical protein